MVDKNFDFITLINGDKLIIEKNEYEVISTEYDVENILPEDDVQDIYAKSFIKVELHKMDSKSLHPTHKLKYYNKNKIYLLEIKPERPHKLIRPKTRSDIFFYKNKKSLNKKDIETIRK